LLKKDIEIEWGLLCVTNLFWFYMTWGEIEMRNPIENLGDYNKAREALQEVGGSLEILYKNIGDTAVSKAAPKLLFKGGVIGASLLGIVFAGYKGICFIKDRKQKIENEPALKKEFFEAIEAESSKRNEGLTDCDGKI
jgi:hypothetical protein